MSTEGNRTWSSTDVDKLETVQTRITPEEEEHHKMKGILAKQVLDQVHEAEDDDDTGLAPPSKALPASHYHRRRAANAALAAADEFIQEGTVVKREDLNKESTMRKKANKLQTTNNDDEEHDELHASVSKHMSNLSKQMSNSASLLKAREAASTLGPTMSKIHSKHTKKGQTVNATAANDEINHIIKTGGTEMARKTPLSHEKPELVGNLGLRCVLHLRDPKWKKLARCIRDTIYDPEFYDDGTYAPMYVRLAIHGAATWEESTKTGGLEGGAMRYKPEWSDAHNKFCKHIIKRQHDLIKVPNPWASYADIQCLSSYVSIECAGGPVMQFTPGRRDVEPYEDDFVYLNYQMRGDVGLETDPVPNPHGAGGSGDGGDCPFLQKLKVMPGRVLGPEEGHLGPLGGTVTKEMEEKEFKEVCHAVREWFFTRINVPGLPQERYTVALISGGHSFGRCHPEISGYAGPWQSNPGFFNNVYCQKLLDDAQEWQLVDRTMTDYSGDLITGLKPKGIRRQYVNKKGKGELMMLVLDMAMKNDPKFREWLEVYANDVEKLKEDFGVAFKWVTEVGFEAPPEKTGLRWFCWNLRFQRAECFRGIANCICPDESEGEGGANAAPVEKIGQPYSMADVAKHNATGDIWVCINGQVVDLSKFINEHPGGVAPIMGQAGKDASSVWNSIHAAGTIQRLAPQVIIGHIV